VSAYPRLYYRDLASRIHVRNAPTPKGPPSSLVQLRITVWTGDARDTRPMADVDKPVAVTPTLLRDVIRGKTNS
jgi:hypothetical protein